MNQGIVKLSQKSFCSLPHTLSISASLSFSLSPPLSVFPSLSLSPSLPLSVTVRCYFCLVLGTQAHRGPAKFMCKVFLVMSEEGAFSEFSKSKFSLCVCVCVVDVCVVCVCVCVCHMYLIVCV